jgi:hypothetical protein
MLDRLGKPLHIRDAVVILNTFPATIKDFAVHEGELGAVMQRSAGKIGFAYFEEIERSNPTQTIRNRNFYAANTAKTIRPGKFAQCKVRKMEQFPVRVFSTGFSASSEPIKEESHEETYRYQTGHMP